MQQLIAKPSLLIFVVIYVIMLVVVGAYYSRKAKTSDEFVRAGGGLGSIVLMGTFLATFTGNGTISGGGEFSGIYLWTVAWNFLCGSVTGRRYCAVSSGGEDPAVGFFYGSGTFGE